MSQISEEHEQLSDMASLATSDANAKGRQLQAQRGLDKFTPGPWEVEDPMAPTALWVVPGGKQTYEWWPIAVCNMPDEEDHLFTGSEVAANARLIAAAPDLLAACQYIVNAGEDGDEMTAIERATAAIARATGAS